MASNSHTAAERAQAQDNHEGTDRQPGAAGDGQESPSITRAEEMVDRLAEQVAHYTSVLGKKLLWLGARAREEAEDIWAEAQNLRRGEGEETPSGGQP